MEQRILTLQANITTAYACEKESFALDEALNISTHMEDCLAKSKKVPMEEQEILMMEAP
jgi:hypothetical protein